jgi:hypothetical protein
MSGEKKKFEVLFPPDNPRALGILATYPPAASFVPSLISNIATNVTIWVQFVRPILELVHFSVVDVLRPWANVPGSLSTYIVDRPAEDDISEFDKFEFKPARPLDEGFLSSWESFCLFCSGFQPPNIVLL